MRVDKVQSINDEFGKRKGRPMKVHTDAGCIRRQQDKDRPCFLFAFSLFMCKTRSLSDRWSGAENLKPKLKHEIAITEDERLSALEKLNNVILTNQINRIFLHLQLNTALQYATYILKETKFHLNVLIIFSHELPEIYKAYYKFVSVMKQLLFCFYLVRSS